MTTETILNVVPIATTVSIPLLLAYAFGIAIILILATKYVLPYLEQANYAIKKSQEFRGKLIQAVPSVTGSAWLIKWTEWEKMIVQAIHFAETFKTEDEDSGIKRKQLVKDLLKKWGMEIDESQEELLDDAINMAVATEGLVGKVAFQKIPFQSSPESDKNNSKA